MKNSIFKTVFTSLLIICISCGNDDKGGDPILNNDTFLTAKVDGVDFEVRDLLFAAESTISGVSATLMNAGKEGDGKSIGIGIANLKSKGTYTLIDRENEDPLTASYASSFIYVEGKTSYSANHFLGKVAGNVNITELNDKYVEGTFNFTGVHLDVNATEKSVTDGRFRFKRLKVN